MPMVHVSGWLEATPPDGGQHPSQGLPPGYPSQGLPGFPGYPSQGLPGGGGQHPSQGPVGGGGQHPSQGLPPFASQLPSGGGGHPSQGLPPIAGQLPVPPVFPDNTLPQQPVYPSLPIYAVPPPQSGTKPVEPLPPGSVWPDLPPLPPGTPTPVVALVLIPGAGWFYVAVDPNKHFPAQGLPSGQPGGGGSTKPVEPVQPKR